MPRSTALAAAILLAVSGPALAGQLPFNGTLVDVGGGPSPAGRCAPDAFTIVWDPSDPAVTIAGTSNYGGFTWEGSECVVPPPPTTSFDGVWTILFDSGDTLFGTRTSQSFATDVFGVFDLLGHWTITGGSGAFGSVIGGEFLETGTLSFFDGRSATFEGHIQTPEPAALSLLGLGLLGLVLRRRSGPTSR